MARITIPDKYQCDKCNKVADAPEDNRGYPDGWGMYEHYPIPGDIKNGDLCDDCIKLVLPEEEEETDLYD